MFEIVSVVIVDVEGVGSCCLDEVVEIWLCCGVLVEVGFLVDFFIEIEVVDEEVEFVVYVGVCV